MTALVEQPSPAAYEAARRIVYRERTVAHEAAHAAALILWLGAVPKRIEVAPFEGVVRPNWSRISCTGELAPALMRVILAGPLAEGVPAPSWPLLPDWTNDEAALKRLCDLNGIDRAGYERIVGETRKAMATDEFCELERLLALALEHRSTLDADEIRELLRRHLPNYDPNRGEDMEHVAVKAAVTEATDLGEFTAIAAAYTIDRQGEQIVRGAFADTIARWKSSGKDLPLHWDHRAGAESVIGSIDSATMRETDAGLYVEGHLDLEDSALAREAWRSLKRNRIGLSFGYLVLDEQRRSDGVKELRAIDLFEITLTTAPANADTRVLSTKSVAPVQIASFEC